MPAAAPANSPRVTSLDALRGFTMMWIVGGGGIGRALKAFGDVQPARFLAEQFEHVQWQGFHFEDLIFPTFVFVAGTSLVFSLTRIVVREGRAAAVKHVLIRGLMLCVLGVIFNGGMTGGFEKVRWLGVLQRIGLAYLGAGMLFLFLKTRGLLVALIALLAGYWALLTFVSVPDVGAGQFWEGGNLADYIDRLYLPGRKYGGDHDPEGLLSTLPAIATCLLGVFAGLLLKSDAAARKKVACLLGGGVALICVAYAWQAAGFPIIKKIWTSSYVLLAGGWSAVLLGIFYGIIDGLGLRRWAQPLLWIGANPITLYFLANLVDLTKLASRFTGGQIQAFFNTTIHAGAGDLVTALTALTITMLFAGFLYRRGIFIRV